MEKEDTQKLSGNGHGRYSETQWPWTWKILRNSVAMDMEDTQKLSGHGHENYSKLSHLHDNYNKG
jgi:hypothetical protein